MKRNFNNAIWQQSQEKETKKKNKIKAWNHTKQTVNDRDRNLPKHNSASEKEKKKTEELNTETELTNKQNIRLKL